MISLSTERVIFDGVTTLLQIRHANESDAPVVLDWRNDPLAVEMSFPACCHDTPAQRFSDNLSDDKSTILIGICDEQRIGVLVFSRRWGLCRCFNQLNPIFEGGLAKYYYDKLWQVISNTSTQTLFARIKNSNHVSMRILKAVILLRCLPILFLMFSV